MTSNQIEFQKYLETRRHNLATEGLSSREISETQRHNLSTEGIQRVSLGETQRHNVQTENINWYTAESTAQLQNAQARNYIEQAATESTKRSLNLANAMKGYEEVENLRQQQAEIRQRIQTLTDQSAEAAAKVEYYKAATANQSAQASDYREQINKIIAETEATLAEIENKKKELGIKQQEADIKQQEAITHRRAQQSRSFRDIVETGTNVFGKVAPIISAK